MANELFFDHETNEKDLESSKSSTFTFVLASLFGALGIHRFYTGYIGLGFLQLFTLGGFGLWTFIDVIAIATNRYEDSKGKLLKNYNKNAIIITIIILSLLSITASKQLIDFAKDFADRLQDEITQMDTPLDNVTTAQKNSHTHKLLKEENYNSNTKTAAKPTYNLDGENVIKSKVGLHILNSEVCEGEKNIRMVCGEVVNSTKEYKNNVEIKIHLFNSSKKFVAFTEAKVYSIAPGETWNFKAPIYYGTVAGYKITNITAN